MWKRLSSREEAITRVPWMSVISRNALDISEPLNLDPYEMDEVFHEYLLFKRRIGCGGVSGGRVFFAPRIKMVVQAESNCSMLSPT
mmetsp:Transcript_8756/g.18170  ORF Transcript_8756/g.18170 Transcript_8756/m.18170 type:complete len:86 (+) Transcript_8756:958-1215(+)